MTVNPKVRLTAEFIKNSMNADANDSLPMEINHHSTVLLPVSTALTKADFFKDPNIKEPYQTIVFTGANSFNKDYVVYNMKVTHLLTAGTAGSAAALQVQYLIENNAIFTISQNGTEIAKLSLQELVGPHLENNGGSLASVGRDGAWYTLQVPLVILKNSRLEFSIQFPQGITLSATGVVYTSYDANATTTGWPITLQLNGIALKNGAYEKV